MRVMLDSFSGAVADLPKHFKSDHMAGLRGLHRSTMVSTWDMGESSALQDSVRHLIDEKLIVDDQSVGYPWHCYRLTKKGRQAAGNEAVNDPR